jgi:predicted component of type VI protein secretion system
MRFRLRYLQHDLELTEGEFAVGRNASCQLSLDDPLVSRRHALLIVTANAVTVEDLQSRNGVLVNGERIQGRVTLGSGDRILIGAQEMTLLVVQEHANVARARHNLTLPKLVAATPSAPEVAPVPVAPVEMTPLPPPKPQSAPSAPGSPPPHAGPTPPVLGSRPPATGPVPSYGAARGRVLSPQPVPYGKSDPSISGGATGQQDAEHELSMVRRADAFSLLGGVAEKALAMGRAVEAERILASPLGDVIEACRAGKRVTPTLVDQAARFSAKLATATGKGAWADYVIELYSAQRRPCPAPVIDELYNALRRVTAIDLQRLREYIEDLRSRLQTFGPAERFLFQRLEGLERLAALR